MHTLTLPLAVMLLLFTAPSQAANVVVTRTDDPVPDGCAPGDCSLREAVIAANNIGGPDSIVLTSGTYVLTQPGAAEHFAATGDLDIRDDLTITGETIPGVDPGATTIRGSDDRVFDIFAPATVALHGLSIVDGFPLNNKAGGGILTDGDTLVQDCEVVNNTATTVGGGIAVIGSGTLTLANSDVRDNRAQTDGGGVYDAGLNLVVSASFIDHNLAFGGGGGGIWTAGLGSTGAEITGSRIRDNTAHFSGGVELRATTPGAALSLTHSVVSGNSGTSGGGGIGNYYGTLIIFDSTVGHNETPNDGGGIVTAGTLGPAATTLVGTTVSGNTAGEFGGGIASVEEVVLTLSNSTISGNTSGKAGGGIEAITALESAGVRLINTTIVRNSADSDGDGGSPPDRDNDGGGVSAIIGFGSLTVEAWNSLIALNRAGSGPSDCSGTLTSRGYNLIGNPTRCTVVGDTTGNVTSVDPQLQPLLSNGGETQTHALLPGSPAIDAGENGVCSSTDQRGEPRVDGDGDTIVTCDIGAFEFQTDDPDGDGFETPNDNCASDRNPDQRDSDGDCALPGADPQNCGDVCDPCPASTDDTRCEPATSGGASIGPDGGSFTTDDGLITVEVPPGAVSTEVSVSVTENERQFFPDVVGASSPLYLVGLRPEGQHFSVPVIVTFRWPDRDNDGRIDKGVCVDGLEEGQSCDENGDCAPSTCTRTTAPSEENLVLKRNGAKFGRFGFELPVGLTPDEYTCAAHELAAAGTNGCAVAVADCSDAAGTGEASVANCCNTAGTPLSDWAFQTCDFSTVLIGASYADLIPGKGSPKTDCVAEWAIDNPANDPFTDKRGRPHFKQTCVDGDERCDADGTANGECVFEVGVCLNVPDERLVKRSAEIACTPTDVAVWELKKPRPDSRKPIEATNAVALRAAVASLGTATVDGKHQERLTFAPPVAVPDTCTELVPLRVPLKGPDQDKKGKATVKARATTSPPLGGKGTRDSDTLKLTCLFAGG